jgi:hypothetical protein
MKKVGFHSAEKIRNENEMNLLLRGKEHSL